MTVAEYIFSEEGDALCKAFCERFGGWIGFLEGECCFLLYSSDVDSSQSDDYAIPVDDPSKQFRDILKESLRKDVNLIPRYYERYEYVDYGPDVDY